MLAGALQLIAAIVLCIHTLRMYYVYELIDPRDRRPFYIGKGTGRRKHMHVRDARAGKIGKKCERIREIIAAGLNVGVAIVREFDDEAAAYAFERRRIAKLGLSNLTNIAPGGGSARRTPIEQCQKVPREQVLALLTRVVSRPEPRHGLWAAALHRAAVRALPRLIENRA